jgi:hypothetical protein
VPPAYSVVEVFTVAPPQFLPALMLKRLWLALPSAFLSSYLPQPVSRAAWATRKRAGMPVALLASTA